MLRSHHSLNQGRHALENSFRWWLNLKVTTVSFCHSRCRWDSISSGNIPGYTTPMSVSKINLRGKCPFCSERSLYEVDFGNSLNWVCYLSNNLCCCFWILRTGLSLIRNNIHLWFPLATAMNMKWICPASSARLIQSWEVPIETVYIDA